MTIPLAVGGADVANLRLTRTDAAQVPPGLSVLLGGTPQEAAADLRRVYPNSRKWKSLARVVGTASVGAIRAAGFDVVPVPTDNFPTHARVVHADGLTGFTDENLARLGAVLAETTGC